MWVDLRTPDRPTLALARLEYMLFLPPVAGASLGPPCPCENSWLSWLEGPDCWSAAGAYGARDWRALRLEREREGARLCRGANPEVELGARDCLGLGMDDGGCCDWERDATVLLRLLASIVGVDVVIRRLLWVERTGRAWLGAVV